MSQYFDIHPTHPQARLIRQAADIVRKGGVICYPTDSTYAFGCHLGDKTALERIRALRQLDKRHLLSLVCHDLSVIATYAQVDNSQYRLLRRFTPGPYTFVLQASREVPKRLLQEGRKTIGLRVPEHPVTLALLAELGEPMLSTTAALPPDNEPLTDALDIREQLQKRLDVVVDAGACGTESTTIVDLTLQPPVILRKGLGDWDD